MLNGKTILAVVPARSGSKGIPDKNMRTLGGVSLIGRAGDTLSALSWLDYAVISTDSQVYADEGKAHGLMAPFLRPADLSGDKAGAVETMIHAIEEVERNEGVTIDIALIVEPTSPMRLPRDIEAATRLLITSGADSVVAVSKLDTKAHPGKALRVDGDRLGFYEARGAGVVARQSLEPLFFRNGVCYALTRDTLVNKNTIFTEHTLPLLIERPLVNIDEPIDLDWAEFLLSKGYGHE